MTMQPCPSTVERILDDATDHPGGIGQREAACPSCGIRLFVYASGRMPAHYFDDDPPSGRKP